MITALRDLAGRTGHALPGPASLQSQVSEWERGRVTPSPFYQRLLCELYGAGPEELGFARAAAPPVMGSYASTEVPTGVPAPPGGNTDDVQRRDFLRMAAVGGTWAAAEPPWLRLRSALAGATRPDPVSVEALQQVTGGLFGLEERVSAAALLAQTEQQLGAATALLERTAGASLRRQVASAAGETAALAGWLTFDLGRDRDADGYWEAALAAAGQAGDEPLRACVLGYRSYQLSRRGDGGGAVAALRAAQTRIPGPASAGTRAWLAGREAEELARLGDARGALAALDRAEAEFAQAKGGRAWTGFLDQARFTGLRVSTLVRLGRTADAYRAAAVAVRAVGGDRTKKTALVRADAAHAAAGLPDVDEAVGHALGALAVSTDTRFRMGVDRVAEVHSALAALAPTPAVRELGDQLAAARQVVAA